jgi:enediyne biosynthesis protein E4
LHKDYASVTMEQLKNDFSNDGWSELKCETSASVWIENLGNGKFKIHELPVQAQFAPINSIAANDVDEDGNLDLIIAGNEYQTAAATGRYDASYGLFLKGNSKGIFTAVNNSGLIIDGDTKDLKIISTKNKCKVIIAAPNDAALKIFLLNTATKKQRA